MKVFKRCSPARDTDRPPDYRTNNYAEPYLASSSIAVCPIVDSDGSVDKAPAAASPLLHESNMSNVCMWKPQKLVKNGAGRRTERRSESLLNTVHIIGSGQQIVNLPGKEKSNQKKLHQARAQLLWLLLFSL